MHPYRFSNDLPFMVRKFCTYQCPNEEACEILDLRFDEVGVLPHFELWFPDEVDASHILTHASFIPHFQSFEMSKKCCHILSSLSTSSLFQLLFLLFVVISPQRAAAMILLFIVRSACLHGCYNV